MDPWFMLVDNDSLESGCLLLRTVKPTTCARDTQPGLCKRFAKPKTLHPQSADQPFTLSKPAVNSLNPETWIHHPRAKLCSSYTSELRKSRNRCAHAGPWAPASAPSALDSGLILTANEVLNFSCCLAPWFLLLSHPKWLLQSKAQAGFMPLAWEIS